MSTLQKINARLAGLGIVLLCFGYFAAYVPYSMLTKMATRGLFSGMKGAFTGFQILPVAILASTLGMFAFLTIARWWKYATHSTVFGFSLPHPKWYTFLSGLCTSGVIITTTLAYTFDGISIVFAMLLMRGGVLVMAPIIDLIAVKRKREIYWPSWFAALLSLGALSVAFLGKSSTAMKAVAAVDISLYLGCYFLRFFIMSNYAKSANVEEKKRYFTEEQMTANSVLFTAILLIALSGSLMEHKVYEFNKRINVAQVKIIDQSGANLGIMPTVDAIALAKKESLDLAQVSEESVPECRMLKPSMRRLLWYGMSRLPFSGYFWHILLLGFLSYGTGLFGSLIFLDRREHTFTAPANRVSSIFSGVIATYLLAVFFGQKYPGSSQMLGVALIVGAIFFLACHKFVEKKRTAK